MAAALLGAILIGAAASGAPGFAIQVQLLAHDGKPLGQAYVSLQGACPRIRKTTDSDGRFSFEIEKPGGYWLWLTGVHHKTLLLPLAPQFFNDISIPVHLDTVDRQTERLIFYIDELDNVINLSESASIRPAPPVGVESRTWAKVKAVYR